jgi:division protein CdvB (Snf7/Vps24/ESCRT-III family)
MKINLGRIGLENEGVAPLADDSTVQAFDEFNQQDAQCMNEIAVELDLLDGAIEEGEETAAVVEEAAAPLQEAVDSGEGIPAPAAEAIRICLKYLSGRTQVPMHMTAVGVESFKVKQTRLNATKIAMEGMKEWAKKIWDAIVAAFDSAIEWVKGFFSKLFDAAVRMKKEAEALKQKSESLAGKTPKAGAKLEKSSLTTKLMFGGKIPDGKTFASFYEKTIATYIDVAKKSVGEDTVLKMLEGTATILASADESVAKLEPLVKEVTTIPFAGNETRIPGETPADGMTLKASATLVGDVNIFLETFKEDASLDQRTDNFGRMKIWVGPAITQKELTASDITPMKPDDCKKVCVATAELADSMLEIKANVTKLEAVQKKIAGEAKRLSNAKDDAGGDDGSKKYHAAASRLARAMLSMSTNGLSGIRTYGVNTGNASLSFVKQSLAALEKEGA